MNEQDSRETVIKDIAGEMVLDVMNVIKQAKSHV